MASRSSDACAQSNFCACKLKQGGLPQDGIVMAGRKPLPTTVKQIKGTLQKCRTNLREPKPQGELVEPPEYMSEGARSAWRYALECAPPHLLKKLDMSVLEVWACAADLYRKAQAGINKTG